MRTNRTFSNLICECLLSVFKVLKVYLVTDDKGIKYMSKRD